MSSGQQSNVESTTVKHLQTKIRRYAPRSIAFLGKRALSTMIGQPNVEWGHHVTGFAGTMAWVLPNPSGLNKSFSLDALVEAYSEFRSEERRVGKDGRCG